MDKTIETIVGYGDCLIPGYGLIRDLVPLPPEIPYGAVIIIEKDGSIYRAQISQDKTELVGYQGGDVNVNTTPLTLVKGYFESLPSTSLLLIHEREPDSHEAALIKRKLEIIFPKNNLTYLNPNSQPIFYK